MIDFFRRLACRLDGHKWKLDTVITDEFGLYEEKLFQCTRCKDYKRLLPPPPDHPHCRCVMIPLLDGEDDATIH